MGLLQIFFAVIFGCVSLLVAFQLMNGKCLQLVYKYDERANHQKQQQEAKAKEIAKLASAVTFAFFATDASLLFYELGRTMGVADKTFSANVYRPGNLNGIAKQLRQLHDVE